MNIDLNPRRSKMVRESTQDAIMSHQKMADILDGKEYHDKHYPDKQILKGTHN